MTSSPRISIITPTYNREDMLLQTINSVSNQTYSDYEHIIIDDSSTDNTSRVVREQNDSRIRYIRNEENRGSNAARNRGLDCANGEILMFIDDDDRWLPKKAEHQLYIIDKHGVDLVYSSRRVVDEDGKLLYVSEAAVPSNPRDDILTHNYIGTPSCVAFRRSILDSAGDFNPKMKAKQDQELWIRVLEQCTRIGIIKEPLVEWTKHDEANTQVSGQPRLYQESFNKILDVHHEKYQRLSQHQLRRAYAGHHTRLAETHANAGNAHQYYHAARSIFYCPTYGGLLRCIPRPVQRYIRVIKNRL